MVDSPPPPSNAAYVSSRAEALCSPSYAPSLDDVLHAREATKGVKSAELRVTSKARNEFTLLVSDPAGQRSSRRRCRP